MTRTEELERVVTLAMDASNQAVQEAGFLNMNEIETTYVRRKLAERLLHEVNTVPLRVAAGFYKRPDGRIFIGQRRVDQKFPGMWEFPGGKMEPGDADVIDTLRREWREELDVDVVVGSELAQLQYHYPGDAAPVRVTFFEIMVHSGVLAVSQFAAVYWALEEELAGYPMLAVDRRFLNMRAELGDNK